MDRISRIIEDIREYGIQNNVPIMSIDTINEITKIIKENNIKNILEIGTAIAYSTICFASIEGIKITSVERDNDRFLKAQENVKLTNFNNINLIHDDALNIDIKDKFDLIIIDAAKSQNMKFFNKFKENLNDKGIIIIDNLSFHGYVGKSNEIKSRNLRQMVRKIEKFLDFLDNNQEFDITYIDVGDKLGVCKKKNI